MSGEQSQVREYEGYYVLSKGEVVAEIPLWALTENERANVKSDFLSRYKKKEASIDIRSRYDAILKRAIASSKNPTRSSAPFSVRTNRMIPDYGEQVSEDFIEKEILLAIREGYECIKIKIRPNTYTQITGAIRAVQGEIPSGFPFRFDANRSFTREDFLRFADLLPAVVTDYIEEPVMKVEDVEALQRLTGLSFAQDESFLERYYEDNDTAANVRGYDVLVLKPGWIGSDADVRRVVENAQVQVVITSAMESEWEIRNIARLAQDLLPYEIHGLDTFRLFSVNSQSSCLKQGKYTYKPEKRLDF